jgi:REP element-mobilizing transposase RayT
VYFVTTCAQKDTAPFTDERLAQVVIDALTWLRAERDVRLYAYCLMPDHLHVLLQLGGSGRPLGAAIGAVKRFSTKASWDMGYSGQLWQDRFYDHVMRTSEDGKRMARYILENPVRRGLVWEAEMYPFSGTPDVLERGHVIRANEDGVGTGAYPSTRRRSAELRRLDVRQPPPLLVTAFPG